MMTLACNEYFLLTFLLLFVSKALKLASSSTMVSILSDDEMLRLGLTKVSINEDAQKRSNAQELLKVFKSFYGSAPIVLALIWEELQTTNNLQARIDASKTSISLFFMVMHFLKCYPTENVLLALFKIPKQTACDKIWKLIGNIQALKSSKVSKYAMATMFIMIN